MNVPCSVLGANYRFARGFINRNSLIHETTLPRAASGIRYANVEICPRARRYSFGPRDSDRPLFVSYVLVTRNETSAHGASLQRLPIRSSSPRSASRCNAHREKVFRFVASASEIEGEATFMKANERSSQDSVVGLLQTLVNLPFWVNAF